MKLIKRKLRNTYYCLKSYISFLFKNKLENKIMFATFQGSYCCNPKAICEEIIKQKLPYKLVWAVFDRNVSEELKKQYPKNVKLVHRGTFKFYREFYSSKIIVENEHNFGRKFLCKKIKGQFCIQTWHGSLGIKKIAIGNSKLAQKTIQQNQKFQNDFDVIVSNSDFETNEVYRTTYWPKTKVLEFGHPRCDILFKDRSEKEIVKILNDVRITFGIKEKEKIFLYAPTFRDVNNNELFAQKDYKKIKKVLEEKFGGAWVIMVRFHEKERKRHIGYGGENFVIDATKYPDMQDLMIAADCGVTDYSSWLYDYVLTPKPGFIYATDVEKYVSGERGLYYPLSETPFPVAKNVNELIENIKNFDEKEYEKKRAEFLKLRGSKENGTASKKIVEIIKEQMEYKKK